VRKRVFKITVAAFGLAVVGGQFVPVDRSNPPVEQEVVAPAQVKEVLQKSCYDCHSHHTKWPWYSYVAPVSWFVAHDVHEGRDELNFSRWNHLTGEKQAEMIGEVWEEVEKGEMPLRKYLITHREARLTDQGREILSEWSKTAGRQADGDHDDE
jgi:hypothetical protein